MALLSIGRVVEPHQSAFKLGSDDQISGVSETISGCVHVVASDHEEAWPRPRPARILVHLQASCQNLGLALGGDTRL